MSWNSLIHSTQLFVESDNKLLPIDINYTSPTWSYQEELCSSPLAGPMSSRARQWTCKWIRIKVFLVRPISDGADGVKKKEVCSLIQQRNVWCEC